MASPYTPQSIVGYNPSPPADDGSQVASNRVTWAGVKTELNDPIKTLAEAIDTAVTSGFGKVLGGVGVTSTAISYTVLSSDQGKLVRGTAASITVTSPDATDVGAPFVFALLNNSSGSITFDGNGSQTVDGSASVSVPAGTGFVAFTDGTNWFTTGRQGTLTGAQLGYGDIVNGTIAEANASNSATFSLKTLAGADPSATDPVLVCFRSPTAASGLFVYRTVTAATTVNLASGSTLGAANAEPFRLALVLFDDAGTVRLGVINPLPIGNVLPSFIAPVATSTAEAGNADLSNTFYSTTGVTSKAYAILGYADYPSGLATAGTWNVSPTTIQLAGHNIPPPGTVPGKVRLKSVSADNSSTSVEITTGITSAFRAYEISVDNLLHATDNTTCLFQVSDGTFKTTGYLSAVMESNSGAGSGPQVSTSGVRITGATAGSNVEAEGGWNGKFTIHTPSGTAGNKLIEVHGGYISSSGSYISIIGGGTFVATSAITGVRILSASGNFVSGKLTLYGLTDA